MDINNSTVYMLFKKVFNEEEYTLGFYIAYSISLITQNSNITIKMTEQNSIIVSTIMLMSYICYVYTFIILLTWIKPDIKLEEEKQKLLKGFVEQFKEKCKDQDLLRRCYSYLEFRIDEDLGRTKDQLTKRLSPQLQDEIDLSLRTIMIDKIELMSKFSPQFKQQLLYSIEQVTFNPEDNIIIEHKSEDLELFYILKGEVKVQFQGSSLANNKRSVTRLHEGQAFGQYSFISGVPSNISIYSCGVTTLLKLKRSEFLEIISNYPQDNEIFCMMKDNSYYNQHLFDCYYCKIKGNYILECKHIQYFPQRQNVIEKYLYSIKQVRQCYKRKEKKYLTLKNLSQNQDKAKLMINKQSQEILSEEVPEASQLPYSENYTYSVSCVSNSMPLQKASQDQQITNSNGNGESLEQLNYEQEQSEDTNPPLMDQSIKRIRQNSNKTSLRTAGFVGNPLSQNQSTLDKDEKEILFQLQEGQRNEVMNQKQQFLSNSNRNSPNKLTFQFQKESTQQMANKQDLIRQDFMQQQYSYGNLKQQQRQPTNRSHTYTNSYSKDCSNYPSSNSRQNKSQRLSSQTRENGRKTNSANTLSDENKLKQRSQRTGTKQSNLVQQSQFQAIVSPDNQGFFINDVIFNGFDKMKTYKIYYPHNNYDQVIIRQQRFSVLNSKKFRKYLVSPYSIKCFVTTKIRKIQNLIKY